MLQLTMADLEKRIQENLQIAIAYSVLDMNLCFLASYYKARTYQDMFYELGYSSDDIHKDIMGLFKTCETKLTKLDIKEIKK